MRRLIDRAGAWSVVAALFVAMVACSGDEPRLSDDEIRARLAEAGVVSLETLPAEPAGLVALGEALFFDPVLSGNQDIACATCHVEDLGTSDFVSLAIGTGGYGTGPNRVIGLGRRLGARNTLDLYNRGYPEFGALGWDGAVEWTAEGVDVPVEWVEDRDVFPEGVATPLEGFILAELADRRKMLGLRGDERADGELNELGGLDEVDRGEIWAPLAARVSDKPDYQALIAVAFPDRTGEPITVVEIARALAAYVSDAYRVTDTPFDRWLAGDPGALAPEERRGLEIFVGEGDCLTCHAGAHLSDFDYHNLAVPQVGLGQPDEEPLDYGRGRETEDPRDRYSFRTPALRNVVLTGPWMHDGAYTRLEAAVRHHLDCVDGLESYDTSQLKPELQHTFSDAPVHFNRILSTLDPWCERSVRGVSESDIAAVVAFLGALTGD